MRRWVGSACLLVACAHPPPALPVATSATPEQALVEARSRRPERYKMVHQVAAQYAGERYLMTGYMLGRKDGAFRVSASAAIGPQLFDVAKLDGVFQKDVHFAPLAKRLDAVHIAQAIDRIYVAECEGDGARVGERFVYRCPRVGDEEADGLQVELDARTLAPLRKTFSQGGVEQVTVAYDSPRRFGEEWIPMRVHLADHRGYVLDLAVSAYQPGFAFSDELLRLRSP